MLGTTNAPARRLIKIHKRKRKIGYLLDVVIPVTTRTRLQFLPCSLLQHLLRHHSLPHHYLCSPPLHLCSFLLCLLPCLALHLLFCFAFCLHLLSCSGLRLFMCSSLRLFPALLLLFLDLLASTPLLHFGIEDGCLVFATGLELQCCHLGPVLGLDRRGNSGGGGLGNVRHVVRKQRTEGTGKTGLIFIDPKFILRQSLQTPHCARRPHDSLIGASWVWPLKGGYCYDCVQLWVLSGYSGRSPLTPVALALIPFH